MKLSIIITIYNLQDYIEECINSIIKQSYKNLEIILVNDGSTDDSHNICKQIEKKDNRIKYFVKENGGASSARNFGLNCAHGDYVMFVDGDDFLYNDTVIEHLIEKIYNDKTNILFFRMATFYSKNNKIIEDNILLDKEGVFSGTKLLQKLVQNGKFSISPCDKIIKMKFLKDNKLYFSEDIKILEDMDWSLKLYLNTKKYSLYNDVAYVYRKQRKGSTTSNYSKKKIGEIYKVIKKWIEYEYNNIKFKNIYFNYLAYQYTILITIINRKNCSSNIRKEIKSIRYLLNYDENFKVRKVKKIYNIIGYNLTRIVLKIYLKLKNKGIYRVN